MLEDVEDVLKSAFWSLLQEGEMILQFLFFSVASVVHIYIVFMLSPVEVLNLKFNIWDLTMYNEFYLTNRNGSLEMLGDP